jgi:hypothetical protein
MIKSEIPLGGPSAEQSVQFTLRVEEAQDALARFEDAMQQANWPGAMVDQFMGDIDTLHGELSEPSPSPTVVQDAGRSMRHTLDVVTARIEVPNVMAAANALWSAIGLTRAPN